MRGPSFLADLLGRISETGRGLIGTEPPKGLIGEAEAILASDGEATLVARTRRLLDRYLAEGEDARQAFLQKAAQTFGPRRDRLDEAIETYRNDPSDLHARALHRQAEPQSQELVRRLNRAQGGTRDLVRMREDLLAISDTDPLLGSLDDDFRHLFGSWFNRGFLELRQIDWSTPAMILEKIILHEAVHAITGWADLRQRVAAPDRMLFAFFHPALPDDPLIFVEVALTEKVPGAIGPILEEAREPLPPARANTAVFYSISNCQPGLRGVSFGNFLIKQVVEELRREIRGLNRFVTLSPVPGLRHWLRERHEPDEAPAEERLRTLAARYLVEAKRGDGAPRDPVARFHLGNGARLHAVHAGADTSARALEQSWGVMVNYIYDIDDIEENHEAFARSGEVAASSEVQRLVRQSRSED